MCNNPCKKLYFRHVSATNNYLCFDTFAKSTAGTGSCDSWCTTDVAHGSGCGNNRFKKCD